MTRGRFRFLYFFIFLSFFPLLLHSQTRFSIEGTSNSEMKFNTVRALVMGISNYKNYPLEKQLEYAADDAMAFYKFLLNRPDIVKPQNIQAFFNEEATDKVRIKTTLYNLIVKESEKNDLVILYFAGHGDVQNFASSGEEGFLLLHNVSRDGDYMAPGNDAIEISEIQKYISLAPEGVKVLLITDACRSGKLISSQKASQRVLASLIQDWQDTYKLVSCQPNQLSYEHKRWGGGHGVFSHYLMYGLKGLADKNGDQYLQFYELFDFVKNRVQKATNYNQIPKAKGDETVTLFPIDNKMKKNAVAQFREKDENTIQSGEVQITQIGSNRSGEDFFYNVPADKRYILRHFRQMTEEGQLVPGDAQKKGERKQELTLNNKNVFTPHTENAFAVALSNDGSIVASGGRDSVIRLTDIQTGKNIAQLQHEGVLALEFSPDGRYLVSGGWDNRIRIWDVKKRSLKKSILAHEDDIRTLCFSRNGKYMASAGNGRTIKIWNTAKWEKIQELQAKHNGRVNDLCFSSNGNLLYSAGKDGQIVVRKRNNGEILHRNASGASVNDLFLIESENILLAGTEKGNVDVFQETELKRKKSLNLSLGSINSLSVDPKGNYLFAGGRDHQMVVFDLRARQKLKTIALPRGVSDISLNIFHQKLGVSMYGGHTAVLKFEHLMPPVADNAYEDYVILSTASGMGHLRGRLKGYYCSALQSHATDIIRPFVNGESVIPSLQQVKKAQTYLHYALKLYEEDNVITRRIHIKQDLLEIFETIIRHQFNNLDESIRNVKQIIDKQPDAGYTHNTLSLLYRKLNELKKAKQSGKVAAKRIPRWTEPKANLGKAFFKEGNYEKAIGEFEKIIDIRPDLAKGYKHRGEVYAFLGNFSRARKDYRKAYNKDSLDPALYYKRAIMYMKTGNFVKAERLLELGRKISPGYSDAGILLGRLYLYQFLRYYRLNDIFRELLLRDAWERLMRTMEESPESLKAKLAMAELYLNVYRLLEEVSEEDKNFMLDLLPQEKPRLILHQAYEWSKAVTMSNPFNMRGHYELARCKNANGHQQEALDYLEKSGKKMAESPLPTYYKGKLMLKNDKTNEARKFFRKALEKDERYLPAYYMLLIAVNREQSRKSGIGRLLSSFSKEKEELKEEIYTTARQHFNSPVFNEKKSLDQYFMLRFFD
jgi:WD40 repeat protein/Flp pilus assembly protein TadD